MNLKEFKSQFNLAESEVNHQNALFPDRLLVCLSSNLWRMFGKEINYYDNKFAFELNKSLYVGVVFLGARISCDGGLIKHELLGDMIHKSNPGDLYIGLLEGANVLERGQIIAYGDLKDLPFSLTRKLSMDSVDVADLTYVAKQERKREYKNRLYSEVKTHIYELSSTSTIEEYIEQLETYLVEELSEIHAFIYNQLAISYSKLGDIRTSDKMWKLCAINISA